MKMLKMCLNWKVIAALAAVGVGFYAIAPDPALAALPFLLIAICPLSMMFMMRGMGNQDEGEQSPEEGDAEPTRDEALTRLRSERADLDGRIGALEWEGVSRPTSERGER
jgi:hypothetical protein